MDRFVELRRKYEAAGVTIDCYRIALTLAMSDAEYDYAFNATRALGARELTMELPSDNAALTERAGAAAAQHKVLVGYHNHEVVADTSWDTALAQSPFNAIQIDVGHYVTGTNQHPLAFFEKFHNRISSVHLKDRLYGSRGGTQVPMGQGDAHLTEVMQAWRKAQWRFPGIIELSYPTPEGSTRTAEVIRCHEYLRTAIG
jgi:sugar phosphate isomerase/epimerase